MSGHSGLEYVLSSTWQKYWIIKARVLIRKKINDCFDKLFDLIQCLANYKSGMEYKNVDFSADKVKQYEAVRQAMARIYVDQPSYFGPERVTQMELINENDLEEKAIIGWSFTIN